MRSFDSDQSISSSRGYTMCFQLTCLCCRPTWRTCVQEAWTTVSLGGWAVWVFEIVQAARGRHSMNREIWTLITKKWFLQAEANTFEKEAWPRYLWQWWQLWRRWAQAKRAEEAYNWKCKCGSTTLACLQFTSSLQKWTHHWQPLTASLHSQSWVTTKASITKHLHKSARKMAQMQIHAVNQLEIRPCLIFLLEEASRWLAFLSHLVACFGKFGFHTTVKLVSQQKRH